MTESSNSNAETETIREKMTAILKTVHDPEIPVNIYELGLIYAIHISEEGCVHIQMTLTSPACPVAGTLPGEVEAKARTIEGVRDVKVELVWDPPWTPARMSEAARLQLNMEDDFTPPFGGKDKFQKLGRLP